MKVFVAKTLVEDVDCNSCSVKLFQNEKDAQEWASREIDDYAADYGNDAVVEKYSHKYTMQSGDCYVTVQIETHSF